MRVLRDVPRGELQQASFGRGGRGPDLALEAFGPGVRTVFLADGNSAALPTESLVAIGDAARQRFPQLERITMYGSANFLDVHGRVPDDRQLMLEAIDEAMGFPLDRFRPPIERLVGLRL